MRLLAFIRSQRFVRFTTRDLVWAIVVASILFACYRPRFATEATRTGRPLDLAINGRGYFVLEQDHTRRRAFTREGRFTIDSFGRLSWGRPIDGWSLQPQVTFASDYTSIQIALDGGVYYEQRDNPQVQQSGQFQLATFTAPDQLRELVPGLWEETQFAGVPHICNPGQSGCGFVEQGRLESQSVDHSFNWSTFGTCALIGLALLAWIEMRILRREMAKSRDEARILTAHVGIVPTAVVEAPVEV